MAAGANGLAEGSTRADRSQDFLGAHGHVNGAEEELQLTGTSVLDQRRERLQLQLGVLLQIVTHQIGHRRLRVADGAAQVQFDGLAGAHTLAGLRHRHQQRQYGPQQHRVLNLSVG